MGNIRIHIEDDRIETHLGRIPIRVGRTEYHFDYKQLIKMIEVGIKKKLKNVIDYDFDYNISKGELLINFYINPNIRISCNEIDYLGYVNTCISFLGEGKPNKINLNIYNENIGYGFNEKKRGFI